MALNQFGNFTQPLPSMTSSEGTIGTYNFIGSSYVSSKIDFQPVEIQDQNRKPLEQPSQTQQYLLNRYDSESGSIPFVCIAGTTFRTNCGPEFDVNTFAGHSFNDIQMQVTNKSGNLYNQIKIESDYIVIILNNFLAKLSSHQTTASISTTATG